MGGRENGRISYFRGFVTLTLTLDRVILHTIMHHSSTTTYVSNFIKIEETFLWMNVRTNGRIGRRTFDSSGGVDLKINNKAVVDIRFRALCNSIIPFAANSPHRLRLKIFRILFVLAWYTELPGIPSVAWRYWRLNYPICSGATVKNGRMLLISPDNPRELPLPLGGFAPPSKTWFLGPTQVFV